MSSIPGLGRSSRGENSNNIPVFLPGKFHGQMSLVGYSPWGHKESDTTERARKHSIKFHKTKSHVGGFKFNLFSEISLEEKQRA